MIYRRTKNIRAVQILLGHTNRESIVSYLDIEVDDALEMTEQTEVIRDLVSPTQKMGRPRSYDRLVLHGILWILCSGAAWRDLPERFGPWSTVYQRFRDWCDDGTFDLILERLHI